MSQTILERDVLKVFDKAINPSPNLNDLDDNFEYLFLAFPFLVHDVN